MIRQIDLVSYLPPYLQAYREQVAALAAENPEFLLIWDAVDKVLYNHFICTADEYGISRYEKILGIRPTEDDNLESRRSRVQIQWVNLIPYTMRTFVQKLKVLCGDTSYAVSGNFKETYELSVITDLENVGQVDELNNLFQEILPMNLIINSKNNIPINVKTDSRFGGRMTTHAEIIITQDFSEKSDLHNQAKAGSAVVYTEIIKI